MHIIPVGSRVLYQGYQYSFLRGITGTVCAIKHNDRLDTGVQWDQKISVLSPGHGGHDCDGTCRDGYGWWVSSQDVLFEDETEDGIIIVDANLL